VNPQGTEVEAAAESAALEVLEAGGSTTDAGDAATDAAEEEEGALAVGKGVEEVAAAVADDVADQLGVEHGTVGVAAVAEDAALEVLQEGGSKVEAEHAALALAATEMVKEEKEEQVKVVAEEVADDVAAQLGVEQV
jgi:hypothetical protein